MGNTESRQDSDPRVGVVRSDRRRLNAARSARIGAAAVHCCRDRSRRWTIAGYNGQPIPMAAPQLIVVKRMKVEGFIVSEHRDVWPEALQELGSLLASGR